MVSKQQSSVYAFVVSYPNTKEDRVSPLVLLITSITGACLPLLRRGNRGGGAAYHAFVTSTMFAFSCAFSAILVYRKPPLARAFRLSAICFSSASLLFFHALFSNPLS